jgi:hypothetical protein
MILKYSYDQTNVSDRTETIVLDLPAGLVKESVSVGSGTLLTHTAGRMVGAMLDNPSNVQWTVPAVPIAANTVNIGTGLPSVGSTCTKTMSYSANPAPPSNLKDGSVSYSNYTGLAIMEPLPPLSEKRNVYYYYDVTPVNLPPVITHATTNMDAKESSEALLSGQTATFFIQRLNDFISKVYEVPVIQVGGGRPYEVVVW